MKRLLAILGLLPTLLWAQVQPNFIQGQVLTAGSLNYYFGQAAAVNNGILNNPTINGGSVSPTSLAAQAANTVLANVTGLTAKPTAAAVPACSGANQALNYTAGTGFGCVGTGGLTAIGANTFLANPTASSALPAATPLPSCSTAGSALLYTTSSGLSCNTAINASTLSGNASSFYAPIANPSFTTGITAAGFLTLNTTSAAIILNDTSGNSFPNILWEANGVNSWTLNSDNTNNVWVLNRYVSGTLASKPLSIAQSTGLVTMTNGVSATPIGATSPSTGAFTTLSASSTVSGTGFSNYLASPPAIGGTVSAAGAFTTLAAASNDNLLYDTTNALSLATATVVTVTTFTKVYDKINTNFNASTGVFTPPQTGYYQVCANFVLASAAGVVGARVLWGVQVGGVTQVGGNSSWMQATGTQQFSVGGCADFNFTQGSSVTVVVTQNTGGTRALDGSTSNFVSIKRIP